MSGRDRLVGGVIEIWEGGGGGTVVVVGRGETPLRNGARGWGVGRERKKEVERREGWEGHTCRYRAC